MILISCGKDSPELHSNKSSKTPTGRRKTLNKKKRQVRKVHYTDSGNFVDHIQDIRNAKTADERAVKIQRTCLVKKEDRPEAISYLNDILERSTSIYEKCSALGSLIAMGSEDALEPVKKLIVFKGNPRLNIWIMKEMRKKYGPEYKKTILDWSVSALNSENVCSTYTEAEIINGLSRFESCNYQGNDNFPDPEPFISHKYDKIRNKIYSLMEHFYPTEKIPVKYLATWINEQIKNKKMQAQEFIDIAKMLQSKSIPLNSLSITFPSEYALPALKNSDLATRQAALIGIAGGWNAIPDQTKSIVYKQIVILSQNDPVKIDGAYPVREQAKELLKTIRKP